MRKIIISILIIFTSFVAIFFLLQRKHSLVSPFEKKQSRNKTLLLYTFDNLKKTKFPASQIMLGRKVNETADVISQVFYFSVPKKPNTTFMERVSGLINVPKEPGIYPVIIMFRGFVPSTIYQSGIGTQPVAQVFAQHGFITLSPDFLGYGESASGSLDGFENRFQTYTTALTLLSSIATLNSGLQASYSGSVKGDMSKIGIWGHSNGGHIALSMLAISGVSYPTVLWAPVSKPFPYSILYYTDEFDDQGKSLRKALAHFEENYDTEQFSPPHYYSWIKASLEINQGTADHEIPVWWSDDLVATMEKNKTDVTYLTYPNADHNLLPNGWSSAVLSNIAFYTNHFGH